MRIKLFFAVIFFFFIAALQAQTISISGTVQDTTAKAPLQNAIPIAIRLNDSTLVKFGRTDKNGFFKLEGIPLDTYIVVISHPQFADQTFIVVGNKQQKELDFGKIILPPKTNTLNEVVVYGYRDKVYYKGDTLMFTADSFKVKQNATVEDLLKKLPGVKVDAKGKITVQGKEVSQVLVDGDEFFGSDPTIATKNLNANTIESVQVYEKKNEDKESKDETVKVMNLKLKDEAKKGYFGKVSVAGGADITAKNKFYESELLLNRFNNKRKISLFGMGANSPRSGFDGQDMWQYGLTNEGNFGQDDEGNSWMMTSGNNQGGIPKTFKSGFYFNDKIGKKTKINTDYAYNQNQLNSFGSTNTQYFLTDTTYSDAQTNSGSTNNSLHRFNFKIVQALDSLTDLTFKPKLTYAQGNSKSVKTDDFFSQDNLLTRQTVVSNTNKNTIIDGGAGLSLNRKFKKKDRNLFLSYDYKTKQEQNLGYLNSENHYILPKDTSILVNQEKINNNSKDDHSAYVAYTEPLTKKIKLEVSYDYVNTRSVIDKKTKDFSGTAYDIENPTLTNNYVNIRQVQRGGTKLIYDVKKFRFAFGAKYRQLMQSSLNVTTDQKLSQVVNNILPAASFRYRFSESKSLGIDYSTSAQQPELNQLQPIINNTNPNLITTGNPNLKPSYRNAIDFNYYSFKPISGSNVWAGGDFGTTNNSITYKTTYDNAGVATSMPVNVNGNYGASAYFGGNIPVFNKWLIIAPNIDANYSKNNNYINDTKNTTKESGVNGALSLRHEDDKIQATIGGSYGYNKTSSTISSQSSQPYGNYNLAASLEYKFPKHFTLESDINYNKNIKRTNGYNIGYVIWNAAISKAFLKKENLIVSINAYDILNQNISTNRSVETNRIVDSKSQVIKQYFLLKVLFKFNSNKEKAEDDEF